MKFSNQLAFVLAVGSMTAFAGAQTAKTHKMNGWINDAKCGAKHDAACAKKCIEAGSKPVFVDSKKNVWAIDNTDSVANYYGDHVKVVASVDAANHIIHIDKVKKTNDVTDKM